MSKGCQALVAMLTGTLLLGPGPRSRAEQAPHVLVVGPIDSYGALLGGVSEGLQSAGFADAPRIRIDIRNARSGAEAKAPTGAAPEAARHPIATALGPPAQAGPAAATAA